MEVGRTCKSVYLSMAILLLATPVLACSLSGLEMSDHQKDCCMQMLEKCGSSQMDESHSCCTSTPTLGAITLHPTVKFSNVSWDVVNQVPLAAHAGSAAIDASPGYVVDYCSKSPPGRTSVLRI